MTTIHIPPAALEAGARVIYQNWHRDSADLLPPWELLAAEYRTRWLDQARAAFVAMVEAWPNGNLHMPVGAGQPRKSFTLPALILPLTENPDDKA